MSDCTLDFNNCSTPNTEWVSGVISPPRHQVLVRITPPQAAPITVSTQNPIPALAFTLPQTAPRLRLTVGSQLGIPGAAVDRDSHSSPVFSYTDDQLTGIAYADGTSKALSYDASNRLASLTTTAPNITRTKTFHYDSSSKLSAITLS